MKKLIALFLALVLALGLMACASSANTETTTQPAETTAPAEETKTEEAAPAEEATEEAAPAAAGSVYWLNFKPESDETLQKVAAMYTEKTGVPVTVVTAASGTYNETLTAEMDKSKMPTLFVVGNQAAISTWGDYCYDLTGTPIANELTTDAYNLYDEDGNKVVPYDKSAELGSAQINTGSKYGYGSWKSSEKSGKCSFDYNVDAGTYYIWVSNTGNSNGTGDIRLTPTFTKESDAALTLLSVRVSKGGSVQLLATVSGKGSIQWSSSDSSIATVSNTGKVSGKRKGNAVITATCGGTALSVNVTVV